MISNIVIWPFSFLFTIGQIDMFLNGHFDSSGRRHQNFLLLSFVVVVVVVDWSVRGRGHGRVGWCGQSRVQGAFAFLVALTSGFAARKAFITFSER